MALQAQATSSQPVTDSSAQASPIKATAHAPVEDSSNQASPITDRAPSRHGAVLPPGLTLTIHLGQAIDSGRLKNGQTLSATLSSPVRTQSGSMLPAGTPVSLTVIESVPAGRLSAAGEFSLQAFRVGSAAIFTDVLTFRGKPGHRDLPDSAAALGTDAGLPTGAPLTFHVQPNPLAATAPPSAGGQTPGSVNGTANGSAPPAGAKGQAPEGGNPSEGSPGKPGQVRSVQPANNSFGPAQNLNQPAAAPNQPSKPSQPQ